MSSVYDRVSDDSPWILLPSDDDVNLASGSEFVPVIRELYTRGFTPADFEEGGALYYLGFHELRERLAKARSPLSRKGPSHCAHTSSPSCTG